jgi:multidrug transporter EmrE-like cation transporter
VDRVTFLAILVSVGLAAVAQVVLKAGVSSAAVSAALLSGSRWSVATAMVGSPLVWLGMCLYVGGALVWLVVLTRVEVSLAYPFVAIGFVLTMLLGWLLQGDSIGLMRISGTLLIAAGVVLVARS